MADTRFYTRLGPITVAELAHLSDARVGSQSDGARLISDVAPVNTAGRDELSYLEKGKLGELPGPVKAGACFVSVADAEAVEAMGVAALIASRPPVAFARAARALVAAKAIGDQATPISSDAVIDPSARLAPGVCVGAGVEIGPDVAVEPNAVIGPGVVLGAGARIGSGAVVTFAMVGAHSSVHAGAVVGDSGFGLAVDAQGPLDAPHFGRVVIGERVTIGANTTVDRGRFDDTIIGDDAKIDNLVQIAHNVQVGRAAVIAGCCGIAGSAVIGDGAALGGSVGVRDHVTIGAGAQIAAATVLMRDVPPGETWAGMPAKPIQVYFREVATLSRLAKTKKRTGAKS